LDWWLVSGSAVCAITGTLSYSGSNSHIIQAHDGKKSGRWWGQIVEAKEERWERPSDVSARDVGTRPQRVPSAGHPVSFSRWNTEEPSGTPYRQNFHFMLYAIIMCQVQRTSKGYFFCMTSFFKFVTSTNKCLSKDSSEFLVFLFYLWRVT
jgi:hypothetical protein